MSTETYRQIMAGRAEIKRIAEEARSGAMITQQSVANAETVMTHAYDADNRNGMGKLTVGDAISAARVTEIHDNLSPAEQKGITEGALHVLVDFGGNVLPQQIANAAQEANAK